MQGVWAGWGEEGWEKDWKVGIGNNGKQRGRVGNDYVDTKWFNVCRPISCAK